LWLGYGFSRVVHEYNIQPQCERCGTHCSACDRPCAVCVATGWVKSKELPGGFSLQMKCPTCGGARHVLQARPARRPQWWSR
jgi:hypothetical protein